MKRDVVRFLSGANRCRNRIAFTILIFLLVFQCIDLFAQQGGDAGIQAAEKEVKGYFKHGVTLMYAIGGLVGLVGAVKVFNKWNSGDQDTGKVAAAWFGSCIFLVVVATVLRGFFGIT